MVQAARASPTADETKRTFPSQATRGAAAFSAFRFSCATCRLHDLRMYPDVGGKNPIPGTKKGSRLCTYLRMRPANSLPYTISLQLILHIYVRAVDQGIAALTVSDGTVVAVSSISCSRCHSASSSFLPR